MIEWLVIFLLFWSALGCLLMHYITKDKDAFCKISVRGMLWTVAMSGPLTWIIALIPVFKCLLWTLKESLLTMEEYKELKENERNKKCG